MAIKKFAMSTSVLMGENACEQIETQLSVFGAKKIMLAQGIRELKDKDLTETLH